MSSWSSRYSYTEEKVKKNTTSAGGVYRLSYKRGDSYYVFYVGQTDDLQRRLLEHLAKAESDKCIKKYLQDHSCYFRYLKESSESKRLKIEQDLIKEYKPKCNG